MDFPSQAVFQMDAVRFIVIALRQLRQLVELGQHLGVVGDTLSYVAEPSGVRLRLGLPPQDPQLGRGLSGMASFLFLSCLWLM